MCAGEKKLIFLSKNRDKEHPASTRLESRPEITMSFKELYNVVVYYLSIYVFREQLQAFYLLGEEGD